MKKKTIFKRVLAVMLAGLFVLTASFAGIGGAVNAAGNNEKQYHFGLDPFSLMRSGDGATYSTDIPESCFDQNGNVTIEYFDGKPSDGSLIFEFKPEDHKVLISKSDVLDIYNRLNDYLKGEGKAPRYSTPTHQAIGAFGPKSAFSIAGTLQKFGESFVMKKSDFEKTGSFTTPALCIITPELNNQWVDGYWFDANGVNSYKPTATWKGSGSECWYEDTSGWYPASQWQLIDNNWYYFDASGYAAYNGYANCNGTWYYFNKNYTYERWGYGGCWRDGYYLNKDGTQTYPAKGEWKCDSKGWWFEDSTGWYATGVTRIDGKDYYFKPDGYMAQDEWAELGNDNNYYNTSWNHYNQNGVRDGWGEYEESGQWYETFDTNESWYSE